MALPILAQLASIAASILGISFIIVFHEFGHFVFCKIFNVYTPTFSIGIGKVLFSKKIGSTDFCISAGPIGGYVEVASEQGEHGSLGFNQIPYYQKVMIMLGGIFCNFLLAYLILAGLFFTGMPENITGAYEPCQTTVSSIAPTSINASNLQAGDQLISVNNEPVNTLTDARKVITKNLDKKTLDAQVIRNNETVNTTINLHGATTSAAIARQLEASFTLKPKLSLLASFKEAYVATIFYTKSIIDGLKSMIQTKSSHGFVGPIMAVAASSKSAQKGIAYLLFFFAILSINLGFMNLLPLPIFDGGQFVIFTIEAIIGRQFSERVRHIIGMCSWILAIGLLVLFSLRDIKTLVIG